ncbi:hypothetical protein PINS_up015855 [Pythium insidiosum]|nr:hypothetical protein PINS_up015855 [Pythium insidiosum]
MLAEAAYFLCPSVMEGYGHYINQARAAGGLILAPDTPPMNELVTEDSGVLISSQPTAHKEQFLGGKSNKEHALRGRRWLRRVVWRQRDLLRGRSVAAATRRRAAAAC